MGCNSKNNADKHMKKNGAFDDSNIIKSPTLFDAINDKMANFSKIKYGLSDNLYEKEKLEIPGKDIYRAIAVEESFKRLDEAIKTEELDLFAFGEGGPPLFESNSNTLGLNFDFSENPGPDFNIIGDDMPASLNNSTNQETNPFKVMISYKKNLKRRVENRLKNIRGKKSALFSNNNITKSEQSKLFEELTKEEIALNYRLKGDVEYKGLDLEIKELTNKPALSEIENFSEHDFYRIETLVNSSNTQDLEEALSIVEFYINIGTFDANKPHNIFGNLVKNGYIDDKGELGISEELQDVLSNLKDRAEAYKRLLIKQEIQQIENKVNSNSSIRKTFSERFESNEKFNYEELFNTKDGLKDLTWLDSYLMDVTNGIMSNNGLIPQVMFTEMKKTYDSKLVIAKDIEDRIDNIKDRLEKVLSKEHSLKIPGISGVSYKIFRAKDSNGNSKDSIVQRYSIEYTNKKKEIFDRFNKKIESSKSIKKFAERNFLVRQAHKEKEDWLRDNNYLVDISSLPEIIENNDYNEFEQNFSTLDDANIYKEKLISIVGENFYKEIVDNQRKSLQKFTVMRDVYIDDILIKEGVSNINLLDKNSQEKIRNWQIANNPFTVKDNYKNKKINKNKIGYPIYSTYRYNQFVPKKHKNKVETGFYDKNFQIIENDETLLEFHKIIIEVMETFHNTLPIEVMEKFLVNSVPALKKSITEILLDSKITGFRDVLEIMFKASREIYDKIRGMFGISPQDNISYAIIDPITKRPNYEINSSFMKSNQTEINKRFDIELIRLTKALNLPLVTNLKQNKIVDLTKVSQEVLQILADNLGTNSTVESIKNRLPNNTDITKFPIVKILKDGITHQVVEEQSFDLPKILKNFSFLTQEFSARQEVLPMMNMLKTHYENIQNLAETSLKEDIVDISNNKLTDGLRTNAIKQIDSWFERVVLGNYNSKNEIGDTRIKNKLKLIFSKNTEIKDEDKRKSLDITGRILSHQDKVLREKIIESKNLLIDEIENPGTNPLFIPSLNKKLEDLRDIEKTLGKEFTIAKSFDVFFSFIRFKALGWNLPSYLTNFLEGQFSNFIIAASGDYFTPENIYRAMHIVKGSTVNSMIKFVTRGKAELPGASKATILMKRYRIMQDATNELQKATTKSSFNKLSKLSPYEGVKRTEYLNQTPLMIAILLDQKIVSATGEESNVWDSMNPDGTLIEGFNTPENVRNWEFADGEDFSKFSILTTKTIVNAHGDSDNLRGNKASEYITGKAMLMFKRWMSRQYLMRFGESQVDIELGVTDFKGRFLSHTKGSATIQGAILGFGGLSLLGIGASGLLIGGTSGYLLAKFYGSKSDMSYLGELIFFGKELLLNVLKIPINTTLGRNAINGDYINKQLKNKIGLKTDFDDLISDKLNQRDIKNLKANLVEMSLTLSWLALILITKAALWEEDEKDEDGKVIKKDLSLHNFLVNKLMQLSSQSAMYVNPTETWKNTVGKLPIVDFFGDVGKLYKSLQEYFEGDDIIISGPNAGQSKFNKQFNKTFVPTMFKVNLEAIPIKMDKTFGFSRSSDKQYAKTAFDKWFESEETTAKKDTKEVRAEYRRELRLEGLTEEEVRKRVDEKFRPKKEDETYLELIEQYEIFEEEYDDSFEEEYDDSFELLDD